MGRTKRIFTVLFFLMFAAGVAFCSEWYDGNRDLSAVFTRNVWSYIERANREDGAGRLKEAEYYLGLAEKKVEETRPFAPSSWPKGWPQDTKALKHLKNAAPDAYLCRIIGDFAYSHNKVKDALRYYEKYLLLSVIPDTSYMAKMAEILQKEGKLQEARMVYENINKVVESRNFHGTAFSPGQIAGKLKGIDIQLKKPNILSLDVFFSGVQDFIKSDFQKIYADETNGMKNFNVIQRQDFDRVITEEKMVKEDFQYPEELSKFGKILNADYLLRPSLTLIDNYFIFRVDVFDPLKQIWFENYEYKTQSSMYIGNLVKRFALQFQGKEIPDSLFLPENEFLWSYETDSLITDLKMSLDGNRVIAGCESGAVYVFTAKGALLRKFSMPEKIVRVAVSPCGEYYAWMALNGQLSFADKSGVIRWKEKLGNYVRDMDISREGRFIVIGVNDEVIFKDRKGEAFWQERVPRWATRVRISPDSHKVFVGMDNGDYWCFSDEGNILWKKNLGGRVTDIDVSGESNYSCAVTSSGKTFIYDASGNELVSFDAGQEVKYAPFKQEIIELMAGNRGQYAYFLSYDKKQLWGYNLSGKVNFIDAMADGRFISTAEGRNIFVFSLVWK